MPGMSGVAAGAAAGAAGCASQAAAGAGAQFLRPPQGPPQAEASWQAVNANKLATTVDAMNFNMILSNDLQGTFGNVRTREFLILRDVRRNAVGHSGSLRSTRTSKGFDGRDRQPVVTDRDGPTAERSARRENAAMKRGASNQQDAESEDQVGRWK